MPESISAEVAALLRQAEKEPLVPEPLRRSSPVLDRAAVERVLPHRDPFLFIDQVNYLDPDTSLVAAEYALARSAAVFAGHFPHHPVWPGALQVEAIAQVGILAYLAGLGEDGVPSVALTHVLSARFLRPVGASGSVELVARVLEEGLFMLVVGQCLYNGEVCSAAAVQGIL